MIRKICIFSTLILIVVIILASCADQPTVCQPVTPLFSVDEAVADPEHPCYDWVYMLQGRVARNSSQSASVWSLRTDAGTGLIVSAIHTLGEGYLGSGGSSIEEKFHDPRKQPGATRIFLVKDDGTVDNLASVLFILYNPEVPPEESGNHLRNVLPRHDFFVGIIDSQKVVMEPFPGEPALLKHESPLILDPANLTTTLPTFAEANGGDGVILLGYPQIGDFAGKLAGSIGVVLSDTEAKEAISKLAALGDEEGGIAYDPEAEMIMEAHASVGMSGGGVFDRDGKQVGILVRASDEYDGVQYIRAVRMTYIVAQLQAALESLFDTERTIIHQYIETTS